MKILKKPSYFSLIIYILLITLLIKRLEKIILLINRTERKKPRYYKYRGYIYI